MDGSALRSWNLDLLHLRCLSDIQEDTELLDEKTNLEFEDEVLQKYLGLARI